MPFGDGPYVIAAAFCDEALQEKDGTISLIRVVDKLTAYGTAEQMPPLTASLAFVLMLRAGTATGRSFTASLSLERPGGQAFGGTEAPVLFADAPNSPANLIVKLQLGIASPGLHWMAVLLDGEPLARTPLMVEYEAATSAPQGPVPG
jgi:hypothetical protein